MSDESQLAPDDCKVFNELEYSTCFTVSISQNGNVANMVTHLIDACSVRSTGQHVWGSNVTWCCSAAGMQGASRAVLDCTVVHSHEHEAIKLAMLSNC